MCDDHKEETGYSTEESLTRLGRLDTHKLLSEEELAKLNPIRKNCGLRPLVTKTRSCLRCEEKFISQGNRLCDKCQLLRKDANGALGIYCCSEIGRRTGKVGRRRILED